MMAAPRTALRAGTLAPAMPGTGAPAPPRLRRLWPALIAVLVLVLSGPDARAQQIRPWVPPSADSLQRWASEAKVLFQTNQGDSIGGANFRAYDLVGMIGRRLIRSLGRSGIIQAHAIKPIVDSLGLDVDVRIDPNIPSFVRLMVRNPWRLTARSVGFLYWYRGDDLRVQGAMYFGGRRPVMRVWWTGYQDEPYSLGVLDRERDLNGRIRLTLFRMNRSGTSWDVVQAPDDGPDLRGAGEAAWVDINADDRPELVAWMRTENDSLFESCLSCPHIIQEHTYTETRKGMWLHDVRLFPGPYATFSLFIRQLADGNRTAAGRLLRVPSRVDEAIAAGWGSRARAKTWVLEYAEEERWPRWLAFLHRGPRGDQRYIVHFELKEGRWIISDWVKPRLAGTPATRADSIATPIKGATRPRANGPKSSHPPGADR